MSRVPTADIAAIQRISAVPTILEVVSHFTGMRLALVARVTRDSWTACAVLDRMGFGLEAGGQLDVTRTLCSEVRDSHEPIVIEHASREPAFCDHPVPRLYGFESYIAVPIFRPGGEYFGNVCALDPDPVRLRDNRTVEMVQLFADLISRQLSVEEESAQDRAELARERETSGLREQFIAVLGHDLRNPLSAVVTGSEFLLALPLEARARLVVERIRASGERMARLIDDTLDFARGRLGDGIPIRREEVEVAALVGRVMDEIASANPGHTLRLAPSGAGTASLDGTRVAQMLSNLVANAVEHSPADEPVDVSVRGTREMVVFSVANRGEPIPPTLMPRLFEPFVRAETNEPRTGLGLGLYIADQIARGHGGRIRAESTREAGTVFTVELPRVPGDGDGAAD